MVDVERWRAKKKKLAQEVERMGFSGALRDKNVVTVSCDDRPVRFSSSSSSSYHLGHYRL